MLRTYSGRNAVIATHEYLNKHAQWSGDRAEVIWNELVVPNGNVKLILCGHNEGARPTGCGRWATAAGMCWNCWPTTSSPSWEGAAAYGKRNDLRRRGLCPASALHAGGQLLVSTYSPAYDKWNYYPEYVDSLVYDLDLIETPLSIRTTDFAVGLDIFPLEASDSRTYDTLAGFTYGGRDFYTPLLLKDSEELLYAVPEDGNDYTEQSLHYGEAWPAGILPSLRFGGENTPARFGQLFVGVFAAADSRRPARPQLRRAGLRRLVQQFRRLCADADRRRAVVTTLHNVQAPAFGESTDLFFGVTAAKNACWNLTLYTRKGKTLNFSQGLYAAFGYAGMMYPATSAAIWSGYIPLDGLVDADDAVTRVAFTSATIGEAIVFDYLFLAGRRARATPLRRATPCGGARRRRARALRAGRPVAARLHIRRLDRRNGRGGHLPDDRRTGGRPLHCGVHRAGGRPARRGAFTRRPRSRRSPAARTRRRTRPRTRAAMPGICCFCCFRSRC